MGKLTTITTTYEMGRQPHGSYTSDKMAVSCTITYEANETPDLIQELKHYSGLLKLSCEKRIMAGVKQTAADQNTAKLTEVLK